MCLLFSISTKHLMFLSLRKLFEIQNYINFCQGFLSNFSCYYSGHYEEGPSFDDVNSTWVLFVMTFYWLNCYSSVLQL